jgi:UDP-GlcNAc:undecaprenyl-phosphate GlcNAc-1-phosphate transferase
MGNNLLYGGNLLYVLNAFVVTALLITWLRPAAGWLGLLDRPNARKLHEGAIPACGGIAMFASILVSNAGHGFAIGLPLAAILALGAIVITGFVDDRSPLPTLPRLVVQAGAATVLVTLGLDGPIHTGLAALPGYLGLAVEVLAPGVAVLLIVGTINAVNMMDGADGLAGGYLTFSFFWLALIAEAAGRPELALEALVIMSAVLGFLIYNVRHRWRSRAAVFMGDAGSTLLGAAIAYLILRLASGSAGPALPTLLWLILIPATDTVLLILRRLADGRSPFQPDRRHLHHLLQDSGLSVTQTTALLAAASALYGGIAYLTVLLRLPESLTILGLLVAIALHAGFVIGITRRLARRAAARAAAGATALGQAAALPLSDGNKGNA